MRGQRHLETRKLLKWRKGQKVFSDYDTKMNEKMQNSGLLDYTPFQLRYLTPKIIRSAAGAVLEP